MATRNLPDISFVRECLDYDPDTGIFTWRNRPLAHFVNQRGWATWNAQHAGSRAGSLCAASYWTIRLSRRLILAHRFAWLMVHGVDPVGMEIDHINGVRVDNRITNLRLATPSENAANKRKALNTKTGIKGVQKIGRGYAAYITTNYKRLHLGYFSTIEKAAEAARLGRIRLHGEFVRHE
jgi:hypothetical protein